MAASRETALEALRASVNDPTAEFRDGQWESIDGLVNHRRRLLVVQRTGWGKSSVYFIATRLLRDLGAGPTLIVSPLLALMRNQVEAASRLRVRAVAINSANKADREAAEAEVKAGRADAVLLSPERLANEQFVEEVLLPIVDRIGLMVVDEAHCISDWGHDFRPDYRRLLSVLQRLPSSVPILSTTATANDRVIEDACRQLGDLKVVRGPLMRKELSVQVLRTGSHAERLAWLAAQLPLMHGNGIVYALTKRDAELVASWLRHKNVDAHAYYSGVFAPGFDDSNAYRVGLEDRLLRNELKVLVATSALGMGFDKPDLGFVIHFQAPGSIIAYYQQMGRAGRAIANAHAVLMTGPEDEAIHQYFREHAFPAPHEVEEILSALSAAPRSEQALCASVNLGMHQIQRALKYMAVENPAPVLLQGHLWARTAVSWTMDLERASRLTLQREVEWSELCAYMESGECRMRAIGRALDDKAAEDCGRCDNCRGTPELAMAAPEELIHEAIEFNRASERPIKCPRTIPSGVETPGEIGKGIAKNLQAREGRVLAQWHETGWGKLAADDKHAGRFRDELVEALAEMIQRRWRPQPSPEWVTCVPSTRHPVLVPDLARRLASRLGLAFEPVLVKCRENVPQKLQRNHVHQCRNLIGVFRVTEPVLSGPVLLVDDMVDSGWTFTVAAVKLLQAGSGPVFPVALASTSTGTH
jgi:ATP-dependent DNA helicase RecQ